MKKAALTFGLFSLVMVATSFATPQTNSSSSNAIVQTSLEIDNGGQAGKNGRKLDVYSAPDQLSSASNDLNSFASDNQLSRSRVKLD